MANFVCFVILSLALFASVAVARPGYALDYYVSFQVESKSGVIQILKTVLLVDCGVRKLQLK